MKTIFSNLFIIILLSLSGQTFAYIGPGVGLSAIGSVLSFIGFILLLIIGTIWYPLKRLMRHLKQKQNIKKPKQL